MTSRVAERMWREVLRLHGVSTGVVGIDVVMATINVRSLSHVWDVETGEVTLAFGEMLDALASRGPTCLALQELHVTVQDAQWALFQAAIRFGSGGRMRAVRVSAEGGVTIIVSESLRVADLYAGDRFVSIELQGAYHSLRHCIVSAYFPFHGRHIAPLRQVLDWLKKINA